MFQLDADQMKQFVTWRDEQDKVVAQKQGRDEAYYGAIGGGYTFCFTPTGLGVALTVVNNVTKEEINLTEYDKW